MGKEERLQDEVIDSEKIDNNHKSEEPERDVENTITETEEYLKMLQRLQADFENYKKRVGKERKNLIDYATENLIVKLLPIVDNFEKAMELAHAQLNPNDAFLEGINMILNQIKNLLKEQGVKEIDAMKQKFDPCFHHAVMKVKDDDYPDNTVIEVLRKGYILKSKVIRPSVVKVVINN